MKRMVINNSFLFSIVVLIGFSLWLLTLGFFKITFKLVDEKEERVWGGWGEKLYYKIKSKCTSVD